MKAQVNCIYCLKSAGLYDLLVSLIGVALLCLKALLYHIYNKASNAITR